MTRRTASVLIAILALALVPSGCLLNTPDRVVKRFVGHLKDMEWNKMAHLVDWPQTAQWMSDFPATNDGQEDRKKEIMIQIAENWTQFPVRRKTADQIRHQFLYLRIARLKPINQGKDWAWMDLKITWDSRAKEVKMLVMKIDRIWRIVLTESVFQEDGP